MNSGPEKVLIPHRGVVALDIIDSLKSIGLETVLYHSPEDANSLPVKLADQSHKFISSKLEDSYLDQEAILEKALELNTRYLHPGYGLLSENPAFGRLCRENRVKLIAPSPELLELTSDKLSLKKLADRLGIPVLPHTGVIRQEQDWEEARVGLEYPLLLKPLRGYGGKGIRVIREERETRQLMPNLLTRLIYKRDGFFLEKYCPSAHQIEIPFFRDVKGNILLLPEIESSVQRRFQKIFQESPSPNLPPALREQMVRQAETLIREIEYIGLGYIEFILQGDQFYFSEINPSFQINSLIPEVHLISNFIKKQFAIANHEELHGVEGTKVLKPAHHIALVSIMAEDPYQDFRPSSGRVTDFYSYASIRNIFRTSVTTGVEVSPLYSPYIGKLLSFSGRRRTTLQNLSSCLENIHIGGIDTNLFFLQNLLADPPLQQGKTTIDYLHSTFDFTSPPPEGDIRIATALLAAAFHGENIKNNYKEKLRTMKQPSFIKRILGIS